MGSADKPSAGTEEGGGAADAAVGHEVRPGAVAVRGPGRGANDGDDDDDDGVRVGGAGRAPANGNEDGTTEEAPPFHVDSYAVHKGPTDEEIRQQILAGKAHAEPVPIAAAKVGAARWPRWKAGTLVVVVGAVAAAIAVGIAVPLSQQRPSQVTTEDDDDGVLASFTYLEWQSSGGFAYSVRAETKRSQYGGSPETSGLLEMVYCRVNQCLESDENCAVGVFYEPGCCFGTDCGAAANQSQCGEYCPPPPASCYLTDPTNATCLRPECYACHQVDGQDTYVIKNTAYAIDCLEVGTAVRPENGQVYK
jgi:hypothetical protein